MFDMNEVYNAISNVGFPIFACVFMAKTQTKTIEKLSSIISSNTRALDRVLDRLGVEHEDNEGEVE